MSQSVACYSLREAVELLKTALPSTACACSACRSECGPVLARRIVISYYPKPKVSMYGLDSLPKWGGVAFVNFFSIGGLNLATFSPDMERMVLQPGDGHGRRWEVPLVPGEMENCLSYADGYHEPGEE